MKVKKNRAELIKLMDAHKLKAEDVAKAVGRTEWSVRQWRSNSGQDIPAHMLELLQLKIDAGMVPVKKESHNDNA